MISITNLTYQIGVRNLFYETSLLIGKKDKIGLVGLNGQGKSTLLKLIHQEISPTSGEINFSNQLSMGFLNQDLLSIDSPKNIVQICMEAFSKECQIQDKINALLEDLAHNCSDKKIQRLGRLQEEFQQLGGYSLEAKAEKVLEGMGFTTKELRKPLNEFSGGWRMRVMLAKILLAEHDLLMLDEPTNHLDLPSIEWLEGYLMKYPGAVIVVSHDIAFLNNIAKKTVEVAHAKLHPFAGNYDFYRKEKIIRASLQQSTYDNQQKKIKKTERFIERFRAKSTKSKQVQSRVKQLEKIERIEPATSHSKHINFHFVTKIKSGKRVVSLANIKKSYGDQVVLNNTSLTVNRGDKIMLIGANGKGKSTVLKVLAQTTSFGGKLELGSNVNMGFYAQHQIESLVLENNIITELKEVGSLYNELQLRTLLGSFLFVGDDVYKPIKVLSGGERSRVALAKTMISNANFLLLDEPTNHLDYQAEEILIQAIKHYDGSLVGVSHNRNFLHQIANKIWYIENRVVKEYPGTFEEYLYWLEHSNHAFRGSHKKQALT